jgi:hypothetical protein
VVRGRPGDDLSNIHAGANLAGKRRKQKAGFQQLLIFG